MRVLTIVLIFFCVGNAIDIAAHPRESGTVPFLSCAKKDGRYFLTVPYSTLGKEMLFVTLLTGDAFGFDLQGVGRYWDEWPAKQLPLMFVLERHDARILARFVRADVPHEVNSEISGAVRANNVAPVFYSFDIVSEDKSGKSFVVDVSQLFSSTLPWVKVPNRFGVSGADPRRSGLTSVRVSDCKVEFVQMLTFYASDVPNSPTNSLTLEMTHAIHLLPDEPMHPRLEIVPGRFLVAPRRFDGVVYDGKRPQYYIWRWRLEPSDWRAYNRGELVTPVKPIILYIDPSMPRKWRSYVKRGIEDWQNAFERAGFRDAIIAVQVEDSRDDWQTPEMHAVVRYVPGSSVAYAGVVHDPRSGEIIEVSIQLGKGKIDLMADRFFVQTAAANPNVRGTMPDSVKGELVRDVISHEVGHALGLSHYMSANRLYPVDSLRSPTFSVTHGLSASVMDYTRGNYVAQPGDGIENFYGRIGEADYWAIRCGYRSIAGVDNPFDEIPYMSSWKEGAGNLFVETYYTDVDHELGDDPVYAGTLGMSNLKLVVENLGNWTNADDPEMEDLYGAIYKQYELLIESVAVGLRADTPLPGRKQDQLRLEFLNAMLFETPEWLTRTERIKLSNKVAGLQESMLRSLLTYYFPTRVKLGDGTSILTLVTQLTKALFRECETGENIDVFRKRVQEAYVNYLITVCEKKIFPELQSSTYTGLALSALTDVQVAIEKGIQEQEDPMSGIHWRALLSRIHITLTLHGNPFVK